MVVEVGGGWGDAFLSGFRSAPGITRGELWYATDDDGKPAAEPGWKASAAGHGRLLSALQRLTGSGAFKIHSREAIENLLRTRLDANERWDRGDGKGPHGEDVIVYGIGAYVLERTTAPNYTRIEREAPELAKMIRPPGPPQPTIERW
jgi:hypothetical protein